MIDCHLIPEQENCIAIILKVICTFVIAFVVCAFLCRQAGLGGRPLKLQNCMDYSLLFKAGKKWHYVSVKLLYVE